MFFKKHFCTNLAVFLDCESVSGSGDPSVSAGFLLPGQWVKSLLKAVQFKFHEVMFKSDGRLKHKTER